MAKQISIANAAVAVRLKRNARSGLVDEGVVIRSHAQRHRVMRPSRHFFVELVVELRQKTSATAT